MNMKEINVNSMEYRKLSKKDKLKVVEFKIKEILDSDDSNKTYEYYNGKRVGVLKSKTGIFKDLCERKRALEKYVTISEEKVDKPIIEAEVVEKTSDKVINEMNLEEVSKRIKYIKKYLYEMTNLYKKDEYKNAKIIKVQGYNGEYAYIPYSKLGDYKALYKYLKLLEMKERELESIKAKSTEIPTGEKEFYYEYLSEDGNPYETGYMQFATDYVVKKNNPVVEDTTSTKGEVSPKKDDTTILVEPSDTTDIKPNNECKDLVVVENKENKKEKTRFGKKILGFLAGTAVIGGICKVAKCIGKTFKKGYNKVKSETKKIGEILRKNKVKTAICACIVAATAVICSFLPKNQSKKHKPDDIVRPTSVVEVTKPTTKEDDIIIDEPVIEEPTEIVTENKEYSLGENVNIEDNSYIYTNSYDATSGTNSYVPYYDNSYDREVVGVTYELDGQLYTIYKYDSDAVNKINNLINKGAKQTAVLVVRSDLTYTGDYEGYYSVDSVKRVKTK